MEECPRKLERCYWKREKLERCYSLPSTPRRAQRSCRTLADVKPLGPLVGEDPEPLKAATLCKLERRLRGEWTSPVTVDRHDLAAPVAEVRWLQRRVRRLEYVLEPLADGVMNALESECEKKGDEP